MKVFVAVLVRDCNGVVRIIVDCMAWVKMTDYLVSRACLVKTRYRNLYLSINSIRSQLGTDCTSNQIAARWLV